MLHRSPIAADSYYGRQTSISEPTRRGRSPLRCGVQLVEFHNPIGDPKPELTVARLEKGPGPLELRNRHNPSGPRPISIDRPCLRLCGEEQLSGGIGRHAQTFHREGNGPGFRPRATNFHERTLGGHHIGRVVPALGGRLGPETGRPKLAVDLTEAADAEAAPVGTLDRDARDRTAHRVDFDHAVDAAADPRTTVTDDQLPGR